MPAAFRLTASRLLGCPRQVLLPAFPDFTFNASLLTTTGLDDLCHLQIQVRAARSRAQKQAGGGKAGARSLPPSSPPSTPLLPSRTLVAAGSCPCPLGEMRGVIRSACAVQTSLRKAAGLEVLFRSALL